MQDSETLDLQDLEVIPRDEFLADFWDYQPGEHITIIGPNGRGKTYLGFQLLRASTSPDMKGYVLVSKPRDETFEMWQKKLRYGTAEEWPPPVTFKKKPGWYVRPYQSGDLKKVREDNARLHAVFEDCLAACYSSTEPNIIMADEAHELQHSVRSLPSGRDQGRTLKEPMEALWMRGRAMKTGLIALAQRSAYNSQHMYNAPNHLFLFNDPDKRNRDRFSEIGGIADPRAIERITRSLGQFQVLYLNRNGPYLCVVDP
jgi:hypothetical protein